MLTPRGDRAAPRAQPAAADGRVARPSRAAPHDERGDRLERRACSPTRSATCSRISASSRRGSRSTRSRRSARADRGTAQGMDALGALVDASLVKQADIDGRSTFSLLAIVREYALGRLEARGEAAAMRNAHADYYAGFVRRVSPGLRGPGQADAVGAAGPGAARTSAPPSATSSTPTGSTTPATSRGACSSTGGSRASSARCASGCSSCSTRRSRSRPTPARVAAFFTLWGEMWRRPVGPGRRRARRVRAAVRRERRRGCRGDGARRARHARGCGSRISTWRRAAGGAARGRSSALHALGNWWGEAMTEVALGLLALAARRRSPSRSAHFGRASAIAEAEQDLFTRVVAGQQRRPAPASSRGDVEAAEREYGTTLSLVGPPALRRGRAVRASRG